jgi:hypothetical protein
MYDIPDEAKGLEAVTAIAERAGEVIVVDEVSLIKIGPARVKIRARDISKVKGLLEIFLEGIGHYIRFIPELPKKKTSDLDPPAKNKNQEGGGGFEDEDDDDLYDSDDDPTKKSQGTEGDASPDGGQRKSGQSGNKHKTQKVGDEEGREEEYNKGSEGWGQVCPIASFNPSTRELVRMDKEISYELDLGEGVVTTQEDSEKEGNCGMIEVSTTQEGESQVDDLMLVAYDTNTNSGMKKGGADNGGGKAEGITSLTQVMMRQTENFPPADHFIVHTEDGRQRFIHRDKWPKLLLAGEEIEDHTNFGWGNIDSQESAGVGEVDQVQMEEIVELGQLWRKQHRNQGRVGRLQAKGGSSRWLLPGRAPESTTIFNKQEVRT